MPLYNFFGRSHAFLTILTLDQSRHVKITFSKQLPHSYRQQVIFHFPVQFTCANTHSEYIICMVQCPGSKSPFVVIKSNEKSNKNSSLVS